MTAFMDGYDSLAETAERLLIDHGYGTKQAIRDMTKYQKLRAAYFMLQGAISTYDDEEILNFTQTEKK